MNDKISGVYQINNIVTGAIYIGASRNIRRRIYSHFCSLRHNYHENPHLQEDYDEYGEDSFRFKMLFACNPEELHEYEQRYITQLNPVYNCVPHGNTAIWTEERRRKLSERMQGNQYGKGYKFSEESKRNMSQRKTGLKHTEETKRKIAESMKGNNNRWKQRK